MIGQEKIKNELSKYSLNTLPQSILFLGEYGCGKHTLANELAQSYNLPLVDITEKVNLNTITEIYNNPLTTMYLINIDELTDREQNVLLKLVEEPLSGTYIILIASGTYCVLNTILNRCATFSFECYTPEQLRTFSDDESILELCTTPGQIKSVNQSILKDTKLLASKIAEHIGEASFSNMLTIVNKVNFKDSYDKIDCILLIRALAHYTEQLLGTTGNSVYYDMYMKIEKSLIKLRDSRLNKESLFTNLLIELWKISRGQYGRL